MCGGWFGATRSDWRSLPASAKRSKDCEWVCKPGSVPESCDARLCRRSFICARRLLAASIATYPNGIARRTVLRARPTPPGRQRDNSALFGLASDGVYQADRVTPIAGALLPHRFSLATHLADHNVADHIMNRPNRSAVYSLLHFP
jgi:hypothetical protein